MPAVQLLRPLRFACRVVDHALSAHAQPRAVEYLLAWLMVGWGASLLEPGPMLGTSVFKYLLVLAPENVWGAFSVSIGLLRLVFLIVNGSWRRSPLIRFVGAMLGMWWWIVLIVLYRLAFADGAGRFPMFYAFYVFLFFEAYTVYRTGRDMKAQGSLTGARRGDGC